MTDETYDNEAADDSKRSTAKRGALAAGAMGVAAVGASGSAAAQDDGEILVFANNYYPENDFEILAGLEQSTTDALLRVDDEEVDEISDPNDWNGYVIRYDDADGDVAGVTTFLFTEASLSEGDSGTLGSDTQMFSPDLNLLSSNIG